MRGIVIDARDKIAAAWNTALASNRPVLIEAMTDPDVPPLPPHINASQARNYLMAIVKGNPDAFRIMKASLKELLV